MVKFSCFVDLEALFTRRCKAYLFDADNIDADNNCTEVLPWKILLLRSKIF
ncbi:hypothetical protein MTBBW1_1730017 [Desulfamplus magnetovallimortis]|uniref:Uncharacterized protein n=1 Tax=Desulfamplus magnetovallimortis TaxID=1246637 RepID=A0A1W1H9W1_9BACT|nr:hypothetical protein MTBBW1_1730017 [Desulfamplus magnetovallimortis]